MAARIWITREHANRVGDRFDHLVSWVAAVFCLLLLIINAVYSGLIHV